LAKIEEILGKCLLKCFQIGVKMVIKNESSKNELNLFEAVSNKYAITQCKNKMDLKIRGGFLSPFCFYCDLLCPKILKIIE